MKKMGIVTGLLLIAAPSFAADCTVHFERRDIGKKEAKALREDAGYVVTSAAEAQYGVRTVEVMAMKKNVFGELEGERVVRREVTIFRDGEVFAELALSPTESVTAKAVEALPRCIR